MSEAENVTVEDESGVTVAKVGERRGAPIYFGTPGIVWGVPPAKPLRNFPEGKARIRLRNKGFAKIFIRTAGGLRAFYVREVEGFWEPFHEIASNATVQSKGITPEEWARREEERLKTEYQAECIDFVEFRDAAGNLIDPPTFEEWKANGKSARPLPLVSDAGMFRVCAVGSSSAGFGAVAGFAAAQMAKTIREDFARDGVEIPQCDCDDGNRHPANLPCKPDPRGIPDDASPFEVEKHLWGEAQAEADMSEDEKRLADDPEGAPSPAKDDGEHCTAPEPEEGETD